MIELFCRSQRQHMHAAVGSGGTPRAQFTIPSVQLKKTGMPGVYYGVWSRWDQRRLA